MLKSAYLLAKIGADTAENQRNFAEFAKTWDLTLPYPSLDCFENLRWWTGHLPPQRCPALAGSFFSGQMRLANGPEMPGTTSFFCIGERRRHVWDASLAILKLSRFE